MAYTTNRYVPNFTPVFEDAVRNGSPASSAIMSNVADNQHWLAFTDTHVGEFINSATTNTSISLRIPVAPGAQFAEFYLLADMDSAKPVNGSEIVITGNTTARTGNISATFSNLALDRAQWVAFNGDPALGEYSTRRVELVSSPNKEFRWATVTVDIATGCEVYFAYYVVLPGRVY